MKRPVKLRLGGHKIGFMASNSQNTYIITGASSYEKSESDVSRNNALERKSKMAA